MVQILVVEDDSQIRDTLRNILDFFGYEVKEASNGREALCLLTDEVAAIITDINMPVMDGLELIRRVGTTRPNLPLIVMSGRPEHKETAMTAGAKTFIAKPPKIQDILDAINLALAP